MKTELNALLITLYVRLDDRTLPAIGFTRAHHPGRKPALNDVVIWGLANPKIGEREAAQTMLDHDRHLIRPRQIIVGDKSFAGREFEAFLTDDLDAHLIRLTARTRTLGSGNSAESGNGSSPCSTP